MVWSLALRPDDAKQDPVVYGTKFGVMFLAEGPPTASIQKVQVSEYCTRNSRATYMSFFLLLFLTFSIVLVANPKKLLYTVANPARGLLNREKRTKEEVWQHTPPDTARSEKNKNNYHATHLQALRRSRSVSRPYKAIFDSSTRH